MSHLCQNKLVYTLNVVGMLFLVFSSTLFAAAPDAIDDEFETASATPLSGILAINDLNLDGPNDQYTTLSAPTNGTLVLNIDSTFEYTPHIGFAGAETFTYEINDGAGGSDTASVTITVAGTSNFLSTASPVIVTQEDTAVPLGFEVSPGLFNGGALLDITSTGIAFRAHDAGSIPSSIEIPAGTSSVVITGFSTLNKDTPNNNDTNDDYQLLNARINLVGGNSSGRIAHLIDGTTSLLDQFNWENVGLGQSVLSDPNKVIGYYATGVSNPTFRISGSTLQIFDTHELETAYHFEFMTSDGNSTNFLNAGNAVQMPGETRSVITLPAEIEPVSGKKGLVILNSISAAAGSDYRVEHKAFNHLVIDLDAALVSGSIAAQQGETENNTVTYSFSDYPLVDLRVGGTPVDVLSSSDNILGDTTSKVSVNDNPTLYIDSSGNLIVERSADYAATYTTMYTSEFYARTGFSSIASFVSVSSDDALFDASPADAVDGNGKKVNELLFDIPASAQVGIFQISWNTIGGNSTNENIGLGFAIIDLNAGTTSGSITFIRTSTPDLLSWDSIPLSSTFFGTTNSVGIPLFQSNKSAGRFTDTFVETSQFDLITNSDNTRTLRFSATSSDGTQNFRDYQSNAQVSWLGNEPFSISGLELDGELSHGSPTASGAWEIDFSEIPLLSYTPAAHETGIIDIEFAFSSTGEREAVKVFVTPVADAPDLLASNYYSYVNVAAPLTITLADSADVDGSETQAATLMLLDIPNSVTLSSSTGQVINNGGGIWTLDRLALPNLSVLGTETLSSPVVARVFNTDSSDLDNDSVIEDGDNGSLAAPFVVDEYDEIYSEIGFTVSINALPVVNNLISNSTSPTLSGTASLGPDEILIITVNGDTYSSEGADLITFPSGVWELTIPASGALPEGTHSVQAELLHATGSSASDSTSDELIIDLTPPPAPGVTSQATQDQTPLIVGTTTIGTGMTLKVSVNGEDYTVGDGQLIDNLDGTWQLQIPENRLLPENLYEVTATLTDAAGNFSTDSASNELLVDTTAPEAPGVTSQVTNTITPIINGTATLTSGDTLSVTVNGTTYFTADAALTIFGDNTWRLSVPATNGLAEDTYNVTATISDSALNNSSDPSIEELTIDLTAPVAPTVTPLTTNLSTPILNGTATVQSGETLTVSVNGVVYSSATSTVMVVQADDSWTLQIPTDDALNDATYEVFVKVTDAAGNYTLDSSVNELIIDTSPPPIPAVDFQLSALSSPVITGTAATTSGDTLQVSVDTNTYSVGDTHLIDDGDGTWTLTIPSNVTIADGAYNVVAKITDSAGNSSVDITDPDLLIDTTPPPAPGITSQTTQNQTPVIEGTTTIGSGMVLQVTVNNTSFSAGDGNLVDNLDGTWTLTIPSDKPLPEALYDVVATLTDAAGNSSSDTGIDELHVDITAPPSPGVTSLATNDITPIINGTATLLATDVLTVSVNLETYTAGDGFLVAKPDNTWSLQIPADKTLADATYDVTATITDQALNISTDPSSQELLVDLTAPMAPTINILVTNTATPLLTGSATINPGELLEVTLNGVLYSANETDLNGNGDGTWSLLVPNTDSLAEGIYSATVTITDAAGNTTSDASSSELTIDLTPPPIPTVVFQLSNDTLPVITGTATVTAIDTLAVTVDNTTYTVASGHLIDNLNGTWTLTVPSGAELSDAGYDVIVSVTDPAGNISNDLTGPDLVIDTIAPPAPGVTSQTTQNQTPVISGTTTIGSGMNLRVTVNNRTYSVGDTMLVDNLDGTWDLTIPGGEELPQALYNVVATLTDAAGNVATDSGTDELLVDFTAPPSPGVTSLTTNDTTPIITGTATLANTDTLRVTINTITYTAGDGNLVNNLDGTWALTIPNEDVLPEAIYDVSATVTDSALNQSSDPSSAELLIDLTAPVAPTVNPLISNTETPTLTGSAVVQVGEVLTVAVNNYTYTAADEHLTDNLDGTWSLTIPGNKALSETVYEVQVSVTDAAGNSTQDGSVLELTIDLTPPPVPTVTFLLSANASPVINGSATITSEDTFTVTVNNRLYSIAEGFLVVQSIGAPNDTPNTTWALTIPADAALNDAAYDVIASVSDAAGNISIDVLTADLVIDTTPPPAPGVTSQTTQDQTPVISGTTTVSSSMVLTVTVNMIPYIAGDGDLVDNLDGTWTLQVPDGNDLPEALYDVSASLTDAAGNTSSDSGLNELRVDITAPPSPGVTGLASNVATPTITGTANSTPGDTLSVTVNSVVYTAGDGSLTHHSDGTWSLVIPSDQALPEATYDVTATLTDQAMNTSSDPGSQELLIDLTAPAAPAINALTTNTGTPEVTGIATVNPGEILSVTINDRTYIAGEGLLNILPSGSWTLTIPAAHALDDNSYEATVTVTDAAGNSTSDGSSLELIIDRVAPSAPTVNFKTSNSYTPSITGTATLTGQDYFEVVLNNNLYTLADDALTDNMDGTWTLVVPANQSVIDGAYDIRSTITDAAGNSSTDTSNPDLVIDTVPPPAPGVTSQTTKNQTPAITGTTTIGTGLTLEVTVNNLVYTVPGGHLIDNLDGTWTLTIPATDTLPEAIYDVSAKLTDAAGNTNSDVSDNELHIDTTAPASPGVTSQASSNATPMLTGTASVNPGDTLAVTVNNITYLAGQGHLVDNGDGTWSLLIPPTEALAEATYDVTATITDSASNTSQDPSNSELLIDFTAPTAPTVAMLSTSITTPVLTGTAFLNPGEILEIEVNSIRYVTGDPNLTINPDGTWALSIPLDSPLSEGSFEVAAIVTDLAGNSNSDASIEELKIDMTAPSSAVLVINEDINDDGFISSEEWIGDANVSVTLPIDAMAGDKLTVSDGLSTVTKLLSGSDINANVVSYTFPPVQEGATLVVTATLIDAAGNSSAIVADSAIYDTTPTASPWISITEDQNNDSYISATEIENLVDLQIVLPIGAASGDTLIYTIDGTTTTLTLTPLTILLGVYTSQVPIATQGANIEVTASLIDVAGNSSDEASDSAILDSVYPISPSVTPLITNSTTPQIAGIAIVALGDTLTVSVNGISYAAGDGQLLDNANGTWTLSLPGNHALAEGIYDISVTVTDPAGNQSTDSTLSELQVDLTAPAVPLIISQTTNDTTPQISGSVSLGLYDRLEVTLNGETYTSGDGMLIVQSGASWSLSVPAQAALESGVYDVTATVIDAAGNTRSDTSSAELTIDLNAPLVPQVNYKISNHPEPVISGTAILGLGEIFSVTLNNSIYTLADEELILLGDNSWTLSLTNAQALADGYYDVVATILDAAGNSSTDILNSDLLIDTMSPIAPGITSQTTNDKTPIIAGTYSTGSSGNSGNTLQVIVNNVVYNGSDGYLQTNTDGTWQLNIPIDHALPDALYDVSATLSDAAGNSASDVSYDELLVDVTAPASPGVTSLASKDSTPIITGTATLGPNEELTVVVNGIEYTVGDGHLMVGADNTWALAIPPKFALQEALYDVTATVIDSAQNSSTDSSSAELLIDLTAPAAPNVLSQITNHGEPVIRGTAPAGNEHELTVTVAGIQYEVGDGHLIFNGDNTWALTIPSSHSLAESIYNVIATHTDSVGNVSTDISESELIVDLTAPATPSISSQTTTDTTPQITGTAVLAPDDSFTVTLNGIVYTPGDGYLQVNNNGTWELSVPDSAALLPGNYSVSSSVTDIAGNGSTAAANATVLVLPATTEGKPTEPTTPPTVPPTTPVTVVTTPLPAFTALLTANSSVDQLTEYPLITGTSNLADGTTVTITDSDGNTVCIATILAGEWSCTSNLAFPAGIHNLMASTSDAMGNPLVTTLTAGISSDFDADGIPNTLEGNADSDGDGVPDNKDLDTDNDGIPDRQETTRDSDQDGIPDYRDSDSDNDGIADVVEVFYLDQNGDYRLDAIIDLNHNGLSDELEQLNFIPPDTDFDGVPDYLDVDSDQDGLPDLLENDGLDTNDDGRIDDFMDTNADGVDDSYQLAASVARDTDGDSQPDYLDSDSDNDGLADLIEANGEDANSDGIVDSLSDQDRDSIPDSVDVDVTAGIDINDNGIDDRFDALIQLDQDQDGDGISDAYDPDINGDGYADNRLLTLALAMALPDSDNNGVPDVQQAGTGELRIGLSGRGGCSINTNNNIDPSLVFMASFSLIMTCLRRRRTCRPVVAVLITMLLLTFQAQADEFDPRVYFGIGVGGSYLDSDDSQSTVKFTTHSDLAKNLSVGIDISSQFSIEMQQMFLGDAKLSSGDSVTYKSTNVSVLLKGGKSQSRDVRSGFSYYGRLGAGKLENRSPARFTQVNDVHALIGAGIEYALPNGLAARAEIISFDTDIHYAGLQLLYKTDGRPSPLPKQKPVQRPVETQDQNTRLEQEQVAQEISLIVIFHSTNNASAGLEYKTALEKVARLLNDNSDHAALIEGYADVRGAQALNLILSQRRAEGIRTRLLNLNVDARKINVIGHGETDQFDPRKNRSGYTANRRTHVRIFNQPLK